MAVAFAECNTRTALRLVPSTPVITFREIRRSITRDDDSSAIRKGTPNWREAAPRFVQGPVGYFPSCVQSFVSVCSALSLIAMMGSKRVASPILILDPFLDARSA